MLIFATLIVAVYVLSMGYVFALRGNERFASLTEYLRKGWPLFAPLNCALYLMTRREARDAILSDAAVAELKLLRDNWTTFRDEALALHNAGTFEAVANPESSSFYDIGFRTFYKRGWSKFYLTWYGTTHPSALRLCPRSVAILSQLKTMNGCMFAILPPGGQLSRHLDPFACSLRYHMGLATPNNDACFISVDGQLKSWRDGEAFLFDETRLHFVRNDTEQYRVILMGDVERPMAWPGRLFNKLYKGFMRVMVVPNTPEDPRGLGNVVFEKSRNFMAMGQQMKRTNKARYKALKFVFNGVLALALIGVLYVPVWLIGSLF
jgi:beta-hydroxylase